MQMIHVHKDMFNKFKGPRKSLKYLCRVKNLFRKRKKINIFLLDICEELFPISPFFFHEVFLFFIYIQSSGGESTPFFVFIYQSLSNNCVVTKSEPQERTQKISTCGHFSPNKMNQHSETGGNKINPSLYPTYWIHLIPPSAGVYRSSIFFLASINSLLVFFLAAFSSRN